MIVTDDNTEKAPGGVRWHDLQPLALTDTLREVTLPFPWLGLGLALHASPLW